MDLLTLRDKTAKGADLVNPSQLDEHYLLKTERLQRTVGNVKQPVVRNDNSLTLMKPQVQKDCCAGTPTSVNAIEAGRLITSVSSVQNAKEVIRDLIGNELTLLKDYPYVYQGLPVPVSVTGLGKNFTKAELVALIGVLF